MREVHLIVSSWTETLQENRSIMDTAKPSFGYRTLLSLSKTMRRDRKHLSPVLLTSLKAFLISTGAIVVAAFVIIILEAVLPVLFHFVSSSLFSVPRAARGAHYFASTV